MVTEGYVSGGFVHDMPDLAPIPEELIEVMRARQNLLAAKDRYRDALVVARKAGHGYSAIARAAAVSDVAIRRFLKRLNP